MLLREQGRGANRKWKVAQNSEQDTPEPVRLDKWLWAARFYKTRRLAADAVVGGKVQVNGERVKRAKVLRAGDLLRIRTEPYEYHLTVLAPSGRRGSAKDAALLYEEAEESREARARLAEQYKLAASTRTRTEGKPTKKERRQIGQLKGRN